MDILGLYHGAAVVFKGSYAKRQQKNDAGHLTRHRFFTFISNPDGTDAKKQQCFSMTYPMQEILLYTP